MLIKIDFSLTRKILYIYNKLPKQMNSLIVKIKIEQIDFQKFFHKRNILEMINTKYEYKIEKETMRYMLIEYIYFKEIKRIVQVYKVRKSRLIKINLWIILTIFIYIKKTILFI